MPEHCIPPDGGNVPICVMPSSPWASSRKSRLQEFLLYLWSGEAYSASPPVNHQRSGDNLSLPAAYPLPPAITMDAGVYSGADIGETIS